MKKFSVLVLTVLVACLLVAGCASSPAGTLHFYSDVNKVAEKRGEETSKAWFSLFGEQTYPPVDRVAKANGITKIATIERYAKLGILGLWTDYTTIVTGE